MQAPTAFNDHHYVDWCAVLAGAAVAAAISIVLFAFGAGIGLSIISPYEGEGASASGYFIALALWSVWVVVSSFMAGGYLTGRMRPRAGDGTEHEVEMRDGAHGVITWAVGLVAAALLVAMGVSGVLGFTAKAGAGAAAVAASRDTGSMTDYTIDTLLRPTAAAGNVEVTTPETGESAMGNGRRGSLQQATLGQERAEISRLFTYGMKRGALSPDNRAYLSRVVANRTGMSQAEADQRVNQVIAETKAAADKARKAGILTAFATAATLLIGAAAAAWAATLGGRHRDQNTDHSAFWRWQV